MAATIPRALSQVTVRANLVMGCFPGNNEVLAASDPHISYPSSVAQGNDGVWEPVTVAVQDHPFVGVAVSITTIRASLATRGTKTRRKLRSTVAASCRIWHQTEKQLNERV
jgi:hypothetical protein